MMVLVANLGSTSFKHKLFDMSNGEAVLASGSADRIGQERSDCTVQAGSQRRQQTLNLPDHAAAIQWHLDQLLKLGVLGSLADLSAIGFKAVHGGPISGAVKVDPQVMQTMQRFADVAPQHNPPYLAAMRAFAALLPTTPQVAAFETAYHQTIPQARQIYGIPYQWTVELGIRRYGFHGASHRYIAQRCAQLLPQARRIISCHLGGSCSLCAIQDGRSVANSFGMTAQSGILHASRVGDMDTFALLQLLKTGLGLEEIFQRLGQEGGLLGISGVSSDLREIEQAAATGNAQARLAIDALVESVRHYLGAYLGVLHGADLVVFTGGIGQFASSLRADILRGFEFAGVQLDPKRNRQASGRDETRISSDQSTTAIYVIPTNEEIVVARQTVAALTQTHPSPLQPASLAADPVVEG